MAAIPTAMVRTTFPVRQATPTAARAAINRSHEATTMPEAPRETISEQMIAAKTAMGTNRSARQNQAGMAKRPTKAMNDNLMPRVRTPANKRAKPSATCLSNPPTSQR